MEVVVKGKEYLEDRFLSLRVYEETCSIVRHFATDKKNARRYCLALRHCIEPPLIVSQGSRDFIPKGNTTSDHRGGHEGP